MIVFLWIVIIVLDSLEEQLFQLVRTIPDYIILILYSSRFNVNVGKQIVFYSLYTYLPFVIFDEVKVVSNSAPEYNLELSWLSL